MHWIGPWCFKEEATAQDVLDHETQGGLRHFVKDSAGRPVVSSPGSMRSLGESPESGLALGLQTM